MDLCGFGVKLQHRGGAALLGKRLRDEFSNSDLLRHLELDQYLQHDHGSWRRPGSDRVIRSGTLRKDVWDEARDNLWLLPLGIPGLWKPCLSQSATGARTNSQPIHPGRPDTVGYQLGG